MQLEMVIICLMHQDSKKFLPCAFFLVFILTKISGETVLCAETLLAPSKSFLRQRRSFETYSPGRARSNKKRRCLIPVAEEVLDLPQQSRKTQISDIPNDVLIKIFGCLDIQLHRFVLPLICRQW